MFEDIKVGDTVYIQVAVEYGWRHYNAFKLKRLVSRVTKTQFVVESGERYKKNNGSLISGEYYERAYIEGEDEIEAMNKFKRNVNIASYVNHFRLKEHIKPTDERLIKIFSYMKSIEKLLEDK